MKTIENILIVDVETTGLQNSGSKIIEVGAILFNLKHKNILQQFSTLFHCDFNPVAHLNKIPTELTQIEIDHGAANVIGFMMTHSQATIAHNASFDRDFLTRDARLAPYFLTAQWICTKRQFAWPHQLFSYRLQDICKACSVNYIDAHRALGDCQLLAKCLSTVEDLERRMQWESLRVSDYKMREERFI